LSPPGGGGGVASWGSGPSASARLPSHWHSWAVPTVTGPGPGGAGRRLKCRYGRPSVGRPGGPSLSLLGPSGWAELTEAAPAGPGCRHPGGTMTSKGKRGVRCCDGAHHFGRPGPGGGCSARVRTGTVTTRLHTASAGPAGVSPAGTRARICTTRPAGRGWVVPTEADPRSVTVGGRGRVVHVGSRRGCRRAVRVTTGSGPGPGGRVSTDGYAGGHGTSAAACTGTGRSRTGTP
jgi:hypothetical protein